MATLTEFKEIETPLLKFLRYFRDEKATGTLAYDELQHHIAEYTALIAVAEGMRNQLNVAAELADICTDWNLDEVEIRGKMMPTHEVKSMFQQALAAYEAWKLNIEGEK